MQVALLTYLARPFLRFADGARLVFRRLVRTSTFAFRRFPPHLEGSSLVLLRLNPKISCSSRDIFLCFFGRVFFPGVASFVPFDTRMLK